MMSAGTSVLPLDRESESKSAESRESGGFRGETKNGERSSGIGESRKMHIDDDSDEEEASDEFGRTIGEVKFQEGTLKNETTEANSEDDPGSSGGNGTGTSQGLSIIS
jgi:hypothetical protein